jgi:hypothetical protein
LVRIDAVRDSGVGSCHFERRFGVESESKVTGKVVVGRGLAAA